MAIGGIRDDYAELISSGGLTTHEVLLLSFHANNVSNTYNILNPSDRTDLTFPVSATALTVSSLSALDTSLGTGARTIVIQGLDAQYQSISEVVVLNGLNPVYTTASFYRVNKVFVLTAGSTSRNQGRIYIGNGAVTAGEPALKYTYCDPFLGTNHAAMYTVKAGFQFFISHIHASVGQLSTNNNVLFKLSSRRPGAAWISNGIGVTNSTGRQVLHPYFALEEKTDLIVEAKTSVGTIAGSSLLTGYLRDKTLGG